MSARTIFGLAAALAVLTPAAALPPAGAASAAPAAAPTDAPAAPAPAPAAPAAPAAPGDAARGKVVYEANCAVCHGPTGNGKGKAAYLLHPRPRDFTTGVYKFRSTSSGSIPRDEDLFRTITNGLPGTGMIAWGPELTEQDRWDLVAYVKTFSTRFTEETVESPLAIGAPPPETPALLAEGKVVYEKMKCAECHGPAGKGDGPASGSLRDADGVPTRAFDFTKGGRMKGGSTLADIYRTFSTGLDGSPMPSFAEALPEADRWKLAHYVLSLGRAEPPAAKGGPIAATRAAGPLPATADDPAWSAAPATEVPLRPLWTRPAWADRITVKALYSEDTIVLRLEWPDAAPDADTGSVTHFRDAAALMFPMLADADGNPIEGRPALTMGDPAHPVNVWHWKADWQADLGAKADPLLASPGTWDTYMGLENDPAFKSGLAAGNPISALSHPSPVESLVAAGFGTLTSLPPDNQLLGGEGLWRDNEWVVLVRRPLFPESNAGGAAFDGLAQIPIAFAVWDGAAGDRNGTKAFSEWTTLTFSGGPLSAPRNLWWLWLLIALVAAGIAVLGWRLAARPPRASASGS